MLPPKLWMDSLGVGSKVFLLDTGLDPSPHVLPEDVRTFIGGDTRDLSRHGTLMARIIASRDPMDVGVAPRCQLYVAKTIGPAGGLHATAEALQWAIDGGADVVSMSFAYSGDWPAIRGLVKALDDRGTIVLAAWNADLDYPHSYPGVIAVAPEGLQGHGDLRTRSVIPRKLSEGLGGPHRGSSIATAYMAGIAACAKSIEHGQIARARFLSQLSVPI